MKFCKRSLGAIRCPTTSHNLPQPPTGLPLAAPLQVFNEVARKTVLSALDGINGTVFAYGQTGSGKTFTMTGGTERYVDRGIIPRSIGLIYSELGKRSDCTYTVRHGYPLHGQAGYDRLAAVLNTDSNRSDQCWDIG